MKSSITHHGMSIILIAVLMGLVLFHAAAATQDPRLNTALEREQDVVSLGTVLYVKQGASGDCSSWANSCELQTALHLSAAGDEIWVAEGIYKPDQGIHYASCQDIRNANSSAEDGDYLIQKDGSAFLVYCAGMAGTPKEYLTLEYPYYSNYSQYTAGGSSPGEDVITSYGRIRLLPESLTVDISDQAFSYSYGSLTHPGDNDVTSMPYGVAMDCAAEGSSTGVAEINLMYTPFAIHPDETFVLQGHEPGGGSVFGNNGQTVDLQGGGECGWIAPAPGIDPPYNASGGPILELAQILPERRAAFNLKSSVALYGGFDGIETTRSQRNWRDNPTILSGDIDDTDITVNGVVTDTAQINGMNALNVVRCSHAAEAAVLDGFTITAGYSSIRWVSEDGGGLDNNNCSLSLENLIFSGNHADRQGGGMYNQSGISTLNNVTFTGNSAGSQGGGMLNGAGSSVLTNVTFSGNSAGWEGGGMYNAYSEPTLTNITLSGNSAGNFGGGIYNHDSSLTITNVTITGNTAGDTGGALYITDFNPDSYSTLLTLTNAIVWGNRPGEFQIAGDHSSANVYYSDIEGYCTEIMTDCVEVITINPRLGPLADNGGMTPIHALYKRSPAIDNGSPDICPSHDQRGLPRPFDGEEDGEARCDMGAYEYGTFLLFLPNVIR